MNTIVPAADPYFILYFNDLYLLKSSGILGVLYKVSSVLMLVRR